MLAGGRRSRGAKARARQNHSVCFVCFVSFVAAFAFQSLKRKSTCYSQGVDLTARKPKSVPAFLRLY